MNLINRFNSGGIGGLGLLDSLSSPTQELAWAWVTIGLSALIAIGYCAIAVNWYFLSKLARTGEARAALGRLRGICGACAICGWALYATDVPWPLWRLYNLVLLVLVWRTWSFLCRMKALRLIDERLAQVEELERSATKYRDIAELLPHMVWTATADGRVDFTNRRWLEYAGDNRTWLDAVHPDERPHVMGRWAATVAAREPLKLEARLGGAAGYRTFIVKARPIVHGEAVRWLGACADIEDQKRLAAEKELQARQKSFFLNALSHDLRAPLHNVLLNAHLLKMTAAKAAASSAAEGSAGRAANGPADADVADSVDMIMENAVAAGDLVAKLLDFARVGAQDHNQVESVALAPALHQIGRRFQPVAEEKGLYLRVEAGADVSVLTDRQKFERIVSNLVDNAIKYTQHGGVTLALEVREDGETCVRIADTGIGIPHGSIPYLFDEFYQVNNYERDRNKGFGMGLAICQCLARQLGGSVRLAGTAPGGTGTGGGSCFELALPPATLRPDRGGRPLGPPGDEPDPQAAGLCRV